MADNTTPRLFIETLPALICIGCGVDCDDDYCAACSIPRVEHDDAAADAYFKANRAKWDALYAEMDIFAAAGAIVKSPKSCETDTLPLLRMSARQAS